jgi:hypothetical protein
MSPISIERFLRLKRTDTLVLRMEQTLGGAMEVRWDAVVQDSRFWSERTRPSPDAPAADANRLVCVQVWLFGSLADGVRERPATVEFHGPFSVGDVIAELGRRWGRTFLDKVTAPGGGVLGYCRMFVNGESVDDSTAPIQTTTKSPTQIEMILLTAAEGG